MLKKLISAPFQLGIAAMILLVFSVPGFSQSTPRIKLFGGYSPLLDVAPDYDSKRSDFLGHGWVTSFSYNMSPRWGWAVEANATYVVKEQYASASSLYTLLGGPRFYFLKNSRVAPFGHFLIGVSVGENNPDHCCAVATVKRTAGFGGGIDANISPRLSYRIAQVDYAFLDRHDPLMHCLRISTGFVFKF